MTICEFCTNYRAEGACELGLKTPRRMGCHDFDPGIDMFCNNPKDFVSATQIVQMAAYFGLKGAEMKKVKHMASREERLRATPLSTKTDTPTPAST